MRNLKHHRIMSGLYGISEGDDPAYIWMIERYKGRWYIKNEDDILILGNYDSLEQAMYFLKVNLTIKDFAKIHPWESLANGGTK